MSGESMRRLSARLNAQEAELAALRGQVQGHPLPPRRRTRGGGEGRRGRQPGWRLAVLVLAVALLGVPVGLLASDRYPDVPTSYFHHDDINQIADAGITRIPAGDPYRPNDPVTRGEMASFLARTAGLGSNPPVASALTAQTAATATNATNAQNAVNAQNAASATNAQNAVNAQTATNATNAQNAQNAVNAQNAQNATSATNAANADTVDGKSADEIVRLAFASGGSITLTSEYQDLITVSLTAPSAGFVQVAGTIFASSSLSGCPCTVGFRLIDMSAGPPTPDVFYTLELEENLEDSGAAVFVFPVPAGNRIFAVQARIVFSTDTVTIDADADITALYSPFGTSGAGISETDRPAKKRPRR
jgi:hypothetical protein